jgi:hypothetical protein
MDQISRWTISECVENGPINFGLPMSVSPITTQVDGEETLWGVRVAIVKNGSTVADIAFRFDSEGLDKSEFIDIDPETKFPVKSGKQTVVQVGTDVYILGESWFGFGFGFGFLSSVIDDDDSRHVYTADIWDTTAYRTDGSDLLSSLLSSPLSFALLSHRHRCHSLALIILPVTLPAGKEL